MRYANSLKWLPFGFCLMLLALGFAPQVDAQDWRYSTGYTIQNFGLMYEENSAYTEGLRSTQKGLVEVEIERYLLYRLYISAKADYLLNNQETFLFGGPVDFDQIGVSANLGLQWNKLGAYVGIRSGQMWDLKFRGVTTEGESAWVNSAGESSRLLTALTGGIKYFPFRYLRIDANIHKQLLEPKRFEPETESGFIPAMNAMEFKPYSIQVGLTVSIPLNSRSRSEQRVNHVNETGRLPLPLDFGITHFRSPLSDNTRVTSGFGQRGVRPHQGVDLNVERGRPVIAAASGVVINAGVASGFGKRVEIQHRNGYSTIYAHLDKIRVSRGQKVQGGQRVGDAGDTGLSSGVHLHFELHNDGTPINPTQFINFK
ncbi:MAG: M23 family metallopeptidase [Balneolaceae bacterium]